MNRLHLICNAHIDPVWQWEWEEGVAAAVSTFRSAADFCEEFDEFVFNHNEVILYQWVEEYEPALFKRIQKLVKEGKWFIMGGWFLQPDCNMPSGESFVRQILVGKTYFKEKFGIEPKTAVNFDSFGHSRGLVQIMKKSGYDSYLFMRPDQKGTDIPLEEFVWEGFDGSRIMAHRLSTGYNSLLGQAEKKIGGWIQEQEQIKSVSLLTWGVGNHGGGPSRIDIKNINELIKTNKKYNIVHSTPETYFKELKEIGISMPIYNKNLNASNVGCYTSQIRIKQKHRLLENELYMVEKMLTIAAMQGYIEYPKTELKNALNKLLTSQFHDILPGSSVQPVEEAALAMMDYGLETVSNLRAKAFFALASGQEKAKEGEIPVLIYNPHPFKIQGVFECEFMLADQNWTEEFSLPVVYQNGKQLLSQPEKENSNISLDWRKKVAFYAELQPSQMNRFDCKIEKLPKKPELCLKESDGKISFVTEDMTVEINTKTGLIDLYEIRGTKYLKKNSFQPLVIDDYDDSWANTRYSFRDVIGKFELMSKEDGSSFSGIKSKLLDSVRIIEDGAVRSVVEVLLKYGNSYICQRYKLPKRGTEIELEIRVFWNEKSKMLKLSVPTLLKDSKYIGQVVYGIGELPKDGAEAVSQKWCGIISEKQEKMLSSINDGIYGSDFKDGEMRLSLIRSPGYTALDLTEADSVDRPIMVQDRFSPRIDQGERLFKFWFNVGDLKNRMELIDREAIAHNEKPFVLSFFPNGDGTIPLLGVLLEDKVIQMTGFKKAENSDDYIIRLFEPTGEARVTILDIPFIGLRQEIRFEKFEIKTFRLDIINKSLQEVDLMEQPKLF
jgi:alpha-mannosidase